MLHTTLDLLHKEEACEPGYRKLVKHLGGARRYGNHTPIPLTVILDSNGIDDALWCLRATVEPAAAFSRDLAADFADMVRPLLSDPRSIAVISVARRYARGQATDNELSTAMDAALAAAMDAVWDASGDASWAAAWAPVGSCSLAAAMAAAWVAERSAASNSVNAAQSDRFRARLLAHDADSNPLGEVAEPVACLIPARVVAA